MARESEGFNGTLGSSLEKVEAIRQRIIQNDANGSSILCRMNTIKIKLNSSRKNTLLLIQEIDNVKAKKANNRITFGSGNPGSQKLLVKHLGIKTDLDGKTQQM